MAELSIHAPGQHAFQPKSIGDLLGELRDESSALIEDEMALLKTEMVEKATEKAKDARSLGTAAAVLHAAAFLILLSLSVIASWMLLLMGASTLLSFSLGPLIVGTITGLLGFLTLKKASSSVSNRSPKPEETARSLEETKIWVQSKV